MCCIKAVCLFFHLVLHSIWVYDLFHNSLIYFIERIRRWETSLSSLLARHNICWSVYFIFVDGLCLHCLHFWYRWRSLWWFSNHSIQIMLKCGQFLNLFETMIGFLFRVHLFLLVGKSRMLLHFLVIYPKSTHIRWYSLKPRIALEAHSWYANNHRWPSIIITTACITFRVWCSHYGPMLPLFQCICFRQKIVNRLYCQNLAYTALRSALYSKWLSLGLLNMIMLFLLIFFLFLKKLMILIIIGHFLSLHYIFSFSD